MSREVEHIYEVFNPEFWLVKEKKMLKWGRDVVSMSTNSITTREDVEWDGSVGKSRVIQLVSDYPESKVQFIIRRNTGLLDKNGVEIYESDIITWKTHLMPDSVREVKYDEKSTSYNIPRAYPVDPEIEVIGNIYENPELLESKDE